MSDRAFRKIRPSFGDSGRASSSNPSSTADSGSSENRRKELDNPKRRKTPESITRNACLNCKKARAKCDGRTPCNRCASRGEVGECIYEIHIKHTKEELVKEIKHLQAQNFLDHQIFQALSADDRVPEILDMLRRGESHESILKSIGRTLPDELADLSLMAPHAPAIETRDHEMEDANFQSPRWTSVTSNKVVLDHLFQLYFAWVHPVHSLFDEGHFVNSYHNGDRYCSPVLMNALCAMACHLHAKSKEDVLSYARLGDEFLDVVRSVIDPDDFRITTVQAFAVMFLVETTRGNGLRASSYLKVAIGNLPRVPDQDREGAPAVWRSTVQGIQNLNVEWAQLTFQVPSRIDFDTISDDDGQLNEDQRNSANWHFYSQISDPVPAWPSYQATISREKAKLILIIEDITVALYSQQGPRISAQHLLELYGRLVTWRNSLPDVIGNMETDKSKALPHALSLLILYSNSIVQLLGPLLNFEGFPSHLVEDIIWQHAQKGMSLLHDRYREQFTCRCQPVLQMYCMLHFADLIARYFPGGIEGRCKDGPESIKAGIEMLAESAPGFLVAPLMQEMLKRTAVACSIRFPVSEAGLTTTPRAPTKAFQMNDFIRACTRPSYIQPVAEIRRRFLPSLVEDWLAHSGSYGFFEPTWSTLDNRKTKAPPSEEIAPQGLMQISSLLNSA